MQLDHDRHQNRLTITIGPIDVPSAARQRGHAHPGTISPTPRVLRIPADISVCGFAFRITDAQGLELSPRLLHHLNVVDPNHRELFLPIARRVLAIGKDTPSEKLPCLLFGYPFRTGDEVAVSMTMHNPTEQDITGVTVEVHLNYVEAGRPWPLFDFIPFHVDVAFPHNDRSFDIPPGRTSYSWEGSPAVGGRLVAVGSHLHDYGVRVLFQDMTTGRTIWEGVPVAHKDGRLDRSPIGHLYRRFGVRVFTDHLYRVTVEYDNSTRDTIAAGGMGVLGGVFIPDDMEALVADRADTLYLRDWVHYMQLDRAAPDIEDGECCAQHPADKSILEPTD
jgi:hypothetical protein